MEPGSASGARAEMPVSKPLEDPVTRGCHFLLLFLPLGPSSCASSALEIRFAHKDAVSVNPKSC